MKRLIYWPLILIGVLGAFHILLTGSPIPLWVVDKLNSPKAVASIENDLIKTINGEILPLPKAELLGEHFRLSEDVLKNGVELTPSGEVFGLIRVHHWCGNDPVRYHLARVSLMSLVTMLECDPNMRVSKFGIDPGSLGMLRLPPDQLREILAEKVALRSR